MSVAANTNTPIRAARLWSGRGACSRKTRTPFGWEGSAFREPVLKSPQVEDEFVTRGVHCVTPEGDLMAQAAIAQARYGTHGRVLIADLTTRTTRVEEIDESVYRQFLGGYGLGA